MSFLSKAQGQLVLDLLSQKIDEDTFFHALPSKPDEISDFALEVLRQALKQRDPDDVEFGLHIALYFGLTADYLPVLLALALEDWHTRHEDIVAAFETLGSDESVQTLCVLATKKFSYRAYDTYESLGMKCVHALRSIGTETAMLALSELMQTGTPRLQREAHAQLEGLARVGASNRREFAAKLVREHSAAARRPS